MSERKLSAGPPPGPPEIPDDRLRQILAELGFKRENAPFPRPFYREIDGASVKFDAESIEVVFGSGRKVRRWRDEISERNLREGLVEGTQ
jgi:hypothetical protein